MQTCASSGLLLKPDRPAIPIDRSFTSKSPQGNVWYTYSNISGYDWHYVISVDLQQEFQLYPADMKVGNSTRARKAFYWTTPENIILFADDYPLRLPSHAGESNWPMDYYVIAPVLSNDFVILGEISKFVTVSAQRFANIVTTERSFMASVFGSPKETFKVLISHEACYGLFVNVTCVIGSSGQNSLGCVYSSHVSCSCD